MLFRSRTVQHDVLGCSGVQQHRAGHAQVRAAGLCQQAGRGQHEVAAECRVAEGQRRLWVCSPSVQTSRGKEVSSVLMLVVMGMFLACQAVYVGAA